ncbi:MAG TPA: hypothetical protein VHU89_05935 [Acidobacteriaceae bacterium]|jgi:hypothetical protein|nr:hypothetical protein [Acidobacteriaceae bacterium]
MNALTRRSLFLSALLCAAPLLFAQSTTPLTTPPAPIPTPIRTAHRIFIANAGMDAFSQQAFDELGLAKTNTYDSLYATMLNWKSYQLVSDPAEADLVIEVRCTAPLIGNHDGWKFQRILANTTWQFQYEITLYDAKTHFLLWTLTEPVRPANLSGTWRKNIAAANAGLAGQLQALLVPPPPRANP